MFTHLTVKNTEYKLRLRVRDIIELERKLGKSLVDVIMSIGSSAEDIKFLPLEEMVMILQAGMKMLHHDVNLDKMFDIVEDYIEENSLIELFPLILKLLEDSGVIDSKQSVIENEVTVEEGKLQ